MLSFPFTHGHLVRKFLLAKSSKNQLPEISANRFLHYYWDSALVSLSVFHWGEEGGHLQICRSELNNRLEITEQGQWTWGEINRNYLLETTGRKTIGKKINRDSGTCVQYKTSNICIVGVLGREKNDVGTEK